MGAFFAFRRPLFCRFFQAAARGTYSSNPATPLPLTGMMPPVARCELAGAFCKLAVEGCGVICKMAAGSLVDLGLRSRIEVYNAPSLCSG